VKERTKWNQRTQCFASVAADKQDCSKHEKTAFLFSLKSFLSFLNETERKRKT